MIHPETDASLRERVRKVAGELSGDQFTALATATGQMLDAIANRYGVSREVPKSLYDELGVSKGATAAEIKAAGKKRKVLTHPDRGGDEEQFKSVCNALAVLSDPAKRAEYDRTGVERDSGPDEDNRQALGIVEQELALIINEYVTKGFKPASDPRFTNVPDRIKGKLYRQILDGEGAVPIGEKHKKFLIDFQRRLKIKKAGLEGDLLHRALQRQIEMAEGNIAALKESIRIYRIAIKLIENYDFEQDQRDPFATVGEAWGSYR